MTDSDAYITNYLSDTHRLIWTIDLPVIRQLCDALISVKAAGGRLCILGVGGSAANASHAVNDFRKICQIDAYAPTDNVAELTARTNDDGWAETFEPWLRCSKWSGRDAVLVLSVGGGSGTASPNIRPALEYVHAGGSLILGIVGGTGGATKRFAQTCLVIPSTEARYVESLQSVILHLLANHPTLVGAR